MSSIWKKTLLNRYSIELAEYKQLRSRLEEIEKPKPQDPVQWTVQNRILKGEPFSFEDRPYLLPLYRDTSWRIIIKKSRQMEMTEWIVNWLLQNLLANPHTTAIYAAPRADQVSQFSRDRLRRWGHELSHNRPSSSNMSYNRMY